MVGEDRRKREREGERNRGRERERERLLITPPGCPLLMGRGNFVKR